MHPTQAEFVGRFRGLLGTCVLKVAIAESLAGVRFAPKADIGRRDGHVRLVQKPDAFREVPETDVTMRLFGLAV